VSCALIGITILAAPHVARSTRVQELMASASFVDWFSLLLGCTLVGQYAWRRIAASRRL